MILRLWMLIVLNGKEKEEERKERKMERREAKEKMDLFQKERAKEKERKGRRKERRGTKAREAFRVVKGVAKERGSQEEAKVAYVSVGIVVVLVILLMNRQPRRAQQVQDADQTSVATSATRTVPSNASTIAPSAKSQVRRVYEFDLTENDPDWWIAEGDYDEGEYEVRRLNELDCSDCPSEEAPHQESPAYARESDEAFDFDVFPRDESVSGDFNHSDLRANMWDDPDGHVSECACLSDGSHSDCNHYELQSTSSLWYDMESSEKASECESYVSCDESTPRSSVLPSSDRRDIQRPGEGRGHFG